MSNRYDWCIESPSDITSASIKRHPRQTVEVLECETCGAAWDVKCVDDCPLVLKECFECSARLALGVGGDGYADTGVSAVRRFVGDR